jgi:hypothetical protein
MERYGITTSNAARSRPARPTRNAETAIVGVLPEDKLSRSNAKRAHIVDGQQIGMVLCAQNSRLVLKPLQAVGITIECRGQNLERNDALLFIARSNHRSDTPHHSSPE